MHEYTYPDRFSDDEKRYPQVGAALIACSALFMLLFVVPFLMGLLSRFGPTMWMVVSWIGGGVEWAWTASYQLGRGGIS